MSAPLVSLAKVVLAVGNDLERTTLGKVLHEAGYQLTLVSGGSNLLDTCKQAAPDVLLLDTELNKTDVGRIVRILQRYPDTRATVIMLLTPEKPDNMLVHLIRTLEVFKVIARPLTVKSILGQMLEASKWSQALRKSFGMQERKQETLTRYVEGSDSLLARTISCPMHDKPVKTQRYLVRTGKLTAAMDEFDLPVYCTDDNAPDLAFNRLSVTVCPKCLFASNNPAFFVDAASNKLSGDLPHLVQSTLAADSRDRRRVYEGGSTTIFTAQRTAEDAVASLRLALHCGIEMINAGHRLSPLELLRQANYHLRLAQQLDLMNSPPDPAAKQRAMALQIIHRIMPVMEGAGLIKNLFQAVSLCIWFGKDALATAHVKALTTMKEEARFIAHDAAALERYLPRAVELWNKRDSHRSPVPLPPVAEDALPPEVPGLPPTPRVA